MADILNANSSYASGTNDTATAAVDDATLHAAANINGALSAAVQIQQILGNGVSLIGSTADLVARLAVGISGAGVLDVNDATAFPGPLNIARGGTGQATALLASGTICLFQQTAAPTSWTKLTVLNDYALRVVTGTASTGGGDNFSAVFPQATTASHTLITAEMPAHTHDVTTHPNNQAVDTAGGTAADEVGVTTTSTSTGGGGGHTHGMTMNLRFIDVILASKDA